MVNTESPLVSLADCFRSEVAILRFLAILSFAYTERFSALCRFFASLIWYCAKIARHFRYTGKNLSWMYVETDHLEFMLTPVLMNMSRILERLPL